MDNPIYKVTTAELTSVASAIKTKLGITSSISYPFIKELKMLGGKPYTFDDVMYRRVSGFSELVNLSYIEEGYFAYFSNITSVNAPNASYIEGSAFLNCYKLSYISFPVCSYIKNYAFNYCNLLTTINFPICTSIEGYAFAYCSSLTNINFPVCTTIGNYAFYNCISLTNISFPTCISIGPNAFRGCYNLLSLYLLGPSLVTLSGINAFTSTPISKYTTSTGGVYGSIYVPQSLVSAYKSAKNWSTYSARIVGV